jgi:hypothetical protein
MNELEPVDVSPSSCWRAVLHGAIGFALVSLGGFSVWAFGGRWFYRNVGEVGLYVACAAVFIGLAGRFMSPLVDGPRPVSRFHKAFVPAFLAYAIVWSVCWFALHTGLGEWLGSLLGSVIFALVFGKMLGSTTGWVTVAMVLFVGHSAGYFLGSLFYSAKSTLPFISELARRQIALIGQLGWGLLYGLGFGAGIGFALHRFQRAPRENREVAR